MVELVLLVFLGALALVVLACTVVSVFLDLAADFTLVALALGVLLEDAGAAEVVPAAFLVGAGAETEAWVDTVADTGAAVVVVIAALGAICSLLTVVTFSRLA